MIFRALTTSRATNHIAPSLCVAVLTVFLFENKRGGCVNGLILDCCDLVHGVTPLGFCQYQIKSAQSVDTTPREGSPMPHDMRTLWALKKCHHGSTKNAQLSNSFPFPAQDCQSRSEAGGWPLLVRCQFEGYTKREQNQGDFGITSTFNSARCLSNLTLSFSPRIFIAKQISMTRIAFE